MSIINFKDINCKQLINKENKIFELNGQEVQVIPYLSVGEKYQLIMATLAKADDNGIFNPLKRNMHFKLNIVFMYTNLIFDAEDRMDEEALYDTLTQCGLIQLVLDNMNDMELAELSYMLDSTETKINQYNAGFAGVVDKIVNIVSAIIDKVGNAVNLLQDLKPELLNKSLPEILSVLNTNLTDTSTEDNIISSDEEIKNNNTEKN